MLLKKIDLSTVETITPGAGLTLNFFSKCKPMKCLAAIIAKTTIKKNIKSAFIFDEVFIF